MSKMTVAEAAEHFNVSKEAIHNRIRRGTLSSVIEKGIKYVQIDASPAGGGSEERYVAYIEEENRRLKERTEQLEGQVERLRDQREAMLIAERAKIEQIYKERDEQLKNVLEVFASKLLPPGSAESMVEEAVTAEIVSERDVDDEASGVETGESAASEGLISLKAFLKLKGYGKKKRERLKERFKALAGEDERVETVEGKLYLRPGRYDYRELLQ